MLEAWLELKLDAAPNSDEGAPAYPNPNPNANPNPNPNPKPKPNPNPSPSPNPNPNPTFNLAGVNSNTPNPNPNPTSNLAGVHSNTPSSKKAKKRKRTLDPVTRELAAAAGERGNKGLVHAAGS